MYVTGTCTVLHSDFCKQVNKWIVGRCWSLMHSRVKKLSHWGRNEPDLIECLRKWQPAKGELQSSKEFDAYWPKSVKTFFGLCDLNLSASGKYIMNASTVPKWIEAITILLKLRKIFQDESKVIYEELLNKDRVSDVSVIAFTLYVIFCNEELQDLFGLYSLKEITADYPGQ